MRASREGQSMAASWRLRMPATVRARDKVKSESRTAVRPPSATDESQLVSPVGRSDISAAESPRAAGGASCEHVSEKLVCVSCNWIISAPPPSHPESYCCKSCTCGKVLCANCAVPHLRNNHLVMDHEGRQPDTCREHVCITVAYCPSPCALMLCPMCLPSHSGHLIVPLSRLDKGQLRGSLLQSATKLQELQTPIQNVISANQSCLNEQEEIESKFWEDYHKKTEIITGFIKNLEETRRAEHARWKSGLQECISESSDLIGRLETQGNNLRDACHSSIGKMVRADMCEVTGDLVEQCRPYLTRDVSFKASVIRPPPSFEHVVAPALKLYFNQLTPIVAQHADIVQLRRGEPSLERTGYALDGSSLLCCGEFSAQVRRVDLVSGTLVSETPRLHAIPESFVVSSHAVVMKIKTEFFSLPRIFTVASHLEKVGPKILNTKVRMCSWGDMVVYITRNRNITVTNAAFSSAIATRKLESNSKWELPQISCSGNYIALFFADVNELRVLTSDLKLEGSVRGKEPNPTADISCLCFVEETKLVVYEGSAGGITVYKLSVEAGQVAVSECGRIATSPEVPFCFIGYSDYLEGLVTVDTSNTLWLIPRANIHQ